MTNVTFDPLALGNGGGRAATEVRGRLAAEVREVREKLTSSALSHYGFDIELLRLFAKGRRSSSPAMAGLGAVVAAVATTWVALDTALLWLTLDGAGRWRWKFIFAETFQGITWGLIVWLIGQSGDPEARGFALVLLLLVGNERNNLRLDSTAVTGALTPMTWQFLASFAPQAFPNQPSA